jgi:hypothetical protein
MTRTSKALKRLGVAGLAVVTIGAGVPAFFATAAQAAGPVTAVTFNNTNTSTGPAGTCLNYTVHAADASGPSSAATITVRLVGDGSATQDVDFCSAAQIGFGDGTVANQPAPQSASVLSNQGPVAGGGSVDVGRVITDANGDATFGVVGVQPGSAAITTGIDSNGNGTFDAGELTGQSGTANFTAGGPAGSNANQDAAGKIIADRSTDTAVAGQARAFTLTVTNANAAPTNANRQAGVTPSFQVEQGATVVQGPTSCPVTNNKGVSVCSVTLATAGNYTIRFFVNHTGVGTTPGFDAGEVNFTVASTVQPAPTGTYTVTAVCQAVGGGQPETTNTTNNTCTNEVRDPSRAIKFNVDNSATGGASTANLTLSFAVTGGSGDETVTTGGSPANECQTVLDGTTTSTTDSTCTVTVNDPTPVSAEVLTITASVVGTTAKGTATLTFVNQAADARNIAITPKTATTTPGQVRTFTATVIDSDGKGVAGVVVNWTESGPGAFRNGGSTSTSTTDSTGKATADVTSLSNESGDQTLTATIGTGGTQCGAAANAGSDPRGVAYTSTRTHSAGNCSDTATNTFGTVSPSPSSGGRATLTLVVNTPSIAAGSTARLTATGAANEAYQLQCYTRPSTTYFTARSGSFDATGSAVTFTLSLGRNTRCFIQYATTSTQGASPSVVVNVHTVLSLSTVRTGVRSYIFQGRNLPRVAGQLITLYRVDGSGNEIRTSNLVTDSSGIYRVTRTFTGTGTFQFKVRTSQTLNNAAGVSNTITVNVH